MRPKKAVTVAELMTRSIITARGEETIEAARRMMKGGTMRHLPVVDDGGVLVGIVSDRDLLGATDPSASVATVMTHEPDTVFAETPAYEAVAVMVHHTISCLPVVDAERRLVGLVTQTDILLEAHEMLASDDVD